MFKHDGCVAFDPAQPPCGLPQKLTCTGQVYLPTITCMIQQGETGAVARLMLYNLAFIAPLTAIFVLAYSELRSETLLAVLRKHAALVKFSTALLFLLLFVFLAFGKPS